MSIFSMTSSRSAPLATVSRNGYRFDDHEVERLDAVLGQLLDVLGLAPVRQQPPVDLRMQRLHPTAEHLGERRDLLHRGDRQARVAEHLRRSTGGHERRRPVRRAARASSAMPVLSYTASSARRTGRTSLIVHPRVAARSALRPRAAPRSTHGPRAGSSRCSTAWIRASSESQSSSAQHLDRLLRRRSARGRPPRPPGARSRRSTFTPHASASRDGVRPRGYTV